ncbi:MAG: tRNA pseudouridine(38-40) synthase TruA [Firmicutes bacterium]|nr:tRNA pseudouridine(38-40) synthase TruA [Bacillota bacterium]
MKMLLTVEFDGGRYRGWQAQKNLPTVQRVLTNCALNTYGEKCLITGCSRTDSGVHATGYKCTLEFADKNSERDISSVIPAETLPDALNARLYHDDISVIDAEVVDDDFHPRYMAKSKTYEYYFYTRRRSPFLAKYVYVSGKIDDGMLDRMNAAAAGFIGTHDFSAFMSSGSSVADTERTIFECRLERRGDFVVLIVRGDGFLYNMVRIMAGTIYGCGRGRFEPEDIPNIIKSRDRQQAGETFPPNALFLTHVEY